jgi:hypothetical protein
LLAPSGDVVIEVALAMPTIDAERVPLQQVFMNLISNAIKYTRVARPDVRVHVGWRSAQNRTSSSCATTVPALPPSTRNGSGDFSDASGARQGRGHRHRPRRREANHRESRRVGLAGIVAWGRRDVRLQLAASYSAPHGPAREHSNVNAHATGSTPRIMSPMPLK